MKKFINFIILSLLCYLAILIYRGKGVVDFNAVLADILNLFSLITTKIKSIKL